MERPRQYFPLPLVLLILVSDRQPIKTGYNQLTICSQQEQLSFFSPLMATTSTSLPRVQPWTVPLVCWSWPLLTLASSRVYTSRLVVYVDYFLPKTTAFSRDIFHLRPPSSWPPTLNSGHGHSTPILEEFQAAYISSSMISAPPLVKVSTSSTDTHSLSDSTPCMIPPTSALVLPPHLIPLPVPTSR